MSTTNRPLPDRPNSEDDDALINWLVAGMAIVFLVALLVGIASGVEVSYRNAGCRVLNLTPTPVGVGLSRIDYYLHNSAASTSAIYCGYNPTTLSATPGPSSGDELSPGEGKHICTFADQVVYCITLGTAKGCMDESRMVTPTPTP